MWHREKYFIDKGGPRNSRTFYLRIRLFAVEENIRKFIIFDFDSASLDWILWNVTPNFPIVLDFLYANSRFAVFAQDVSTANYEGRLYRERNIYRGNCVYLKEMSAKSFHRWSFFPGWSHRTRIYFSLFGYSTRKRKKCLKKIWSQSYKGNFNFKILF